MAASANERTAMLRRLTYLLLTSAAFYLGITVLLGFFSDILPLASTEEPQSIWRFEMAFVLTAVQWISLGVAALAAVAITILLCNNVRRPESL
jgi:hypothetical protein